MFLSTFFVLKKMKDRLVQISFMLADCLFVIVCPALWTAQLIKVSDTQDACIFKNFNYGDY